VLCNVADPLLGDALEGEVTRRLELNRIELDVDVERPPAFERGEELLDELVEADLAQLSRAQFEEKCPHLGQGATGELAESIHTVA
jgi:hypothetical protein